MNRPSLNRPFFAAAFVLGLLAIAWVAFGFVGSSALALVVTLLIAAVYLTGAQELRRYRQASAALAEAIGQLPPTPEALPALDGWIARLPAALQGAVRQRVQNGRGALPGLALTPYLIGLLVMLGMLGTFLGLVLTFQGVVFTLEGSADLQAIRSALAAPIKGLGLAFGTSVAGVASSAMLGLMAALSRRERAAALRGLDGAVATVLRPFSLAHQRQATVDALQQQANALPAVVTQLQALAQQLEQRQQRLDEQLLARQAQFLESASAAHGTLARSVEQSLQHSLAASARAAGESLTPVVHQAMAAIAQDTTRLHERLSEAVQQQMQGLSALAESTRATGEQLGPVVQQAMKAVAEDTTRLHERLSAAVQAQIEGLSGIADSTRSAGEQLAPLVQQAMQAVAQDTAQLHERLSAAVHEQMHGLSALAERTQASGESLLPAVQHAMNALHQDSARLHGSVGETVKAQLQGLSAEFGATARTVAEGWTAALQQHAQTGERQAQALEQALGAFAAQFEQRSGALIAGVQEAVGRTQAELGAADRERQAAWTQALQATADTLQGQWRELGAQTLAQQQAVAQTLEDTATQWRQELASLRGEEAARGEAAVQRLGELQAALSEQMAGQLAQLGSALETPMARLMESAAEAPKAAAELIAQLRQEMNQLTERDNRALQERAALMEHIHTLVQRVQQGTHDQGAAIESLVSSAGAVLDQVGRQFADTVGVQAVRAEAVADQVSASAIDVASLGEAFGQGVDLFSRANDQLMEHLQRIESAVTQSIARSDEQLAYYVAQAREVIDLSISSQQGIVEDLRRLRAEALAKAAA